MARFDRKELHYQIEIHKWDYNKSRLNAFDRKDIMNIEDFNELCFKNGLDLTKIIELMKS